MEIVCAYCRAPVPACDVNLDRLLAKCGSCNGVFRFQIPSLADGWAAGRGRRLVPTPAAIKILADDRAAPAGGYRGNAAPTTRAVFEWKWLQARHFFMVFFCLFWDGILVLWFREALLRGPQLVHLFPIVHIGVGVVITYTTICGFVNRTRLTIEDGVLSVMHGPLPWRGNRRLPVDALEQLYCEEEIGSKGGRSYHLSALLKGGKKVRLLTRSEPAHVLYLEHALETRLGIADRAVAGELL